MGGRALFVIIYIIYFTLVLLWIQVFFLFSPLPPYKVYVLEALSLSYLLQEKNWECIIY
jgi:hypothetical protein